MQEGGLKKDAGKPQLSLLDRHALEEIARVRMFGSTKYSPWDWRLGFRFTRLTDAALRHIFAFLDGEDLDSESNLNHIAHAACTLMFLLRMIKDRPDLDDRFMENKKMNPIEPNFNKTDLMPECQGCNKSIPERNICSVYTWPETKWFSGHKCPMATHLKPVEQKKEKALDPIKASKRKFKGI